MKTCIVLVFLLAGAALGDRHVQKRVIQGRQCKPAETKQHVFIKTEAGSCCGSVIANGYWVVTAKHCNPDRKDTTVTSLSGDSQTVKKKNIVPHESVDLLLLRLRTPMGGYTSLPADAECQAAYLQNLIFAKPGDGFVLVGKDTSGTGTNVMCADIYLTNPSHKMKSGEIFHIGETLTCEGCPGDSGGGVIHNQSLHGVYKSGKGSFTVAVDVCSYRGWIETTIQTHKCHECVIQ